MSKARRKRRDELTAEQIKRIGAVFNSLSTSKTEICKRFRMSSEALDRLAEEQGWPARARHFKPPQLKAQNPPKPTNNFDAAAMAAQARAEDEARQCALYGDVLADVRLLRRRDYAVTRERDKIRVGNTLLTPAEVAAMADRERRLMGEPAPARRVTKTAGGLRIGQTVALAPKKPKPAPRPATPRPAKRPELAKSSQARPVPAKAPPQPTKPKPVDHSVDLGKRPRVVWLDLGLLDIDRRYQRDIGDGGRVHVARIRRAFHWSCYQPIVVTEGEGGRYAVIDGQHRLEAALKHPLIDSLPAYIIDAPDVAQQAQIFVEVNSNRRGLTSSQKFWASHAAGDKAAVALAKICKDAGVTILRGPPGAVVPPLSLLGPLIAQRLVVTFGAGPVREGITLLAKTHSKTPGAFRGTTISALTRIAADPTFSRDRMRAVMAAANLDALLAEASTLTKGGGSHSLTAGTERVLRQRIEAST